MILSWKEIRKNWKHFLLVELILILMILMVTFLSGLTHGLAKAISASIANSPAQYYVIADDVDDALSASNISQDQVNAWQKTSNNKVSPFLVQRSYLVASKSDKKLDMAYFAIIPDSFIAPRVSDGKESLNDEEVILDQSFQEKGIHIGDTLTDSSSNQVLKVVGFTKDAKYSHVPVAYISLTTMEKMKKKLNPQYQLTYNALACLEKVDSSPKISGTTLVDKKTIIQHLPGYAAEQATINMIIWVLISVSSAILGAFFYIITIQKQSMYGIMKAIGMTMGEITRMLLTQIIMLACLGLIGGNLLAYLLSLVLPDAMPFELSLQDIGVTSLAFLVISILAGLLSIFKVAKVDPLVTIGGNNV